MANFYYRARDQSGVLVTGEIEAASAEELKDGLFHEGMIPLQVKELTKNGFSLEAISELFNRVTAEELMVFTRQFHTLFKAGVSMDTILVTMAQQVKGSKLAHALIRIRADLSAGASLAQAFGRHPKIFSELYTSMLAAGEEAGILEKVLGNLSELLQKEFEIQKNIKGAVLYPKIVVVVLILAIAFLMTFVVPQFIGFYGRYGADLPLPTKILIGASTFTTKYWYIALSSVGTVIFLWRRFYNTNVGRLKVDKLRFTLPVFGALNMKVANARFGHITSALYSSGLAIPRCLEVVAKVIGNVAYGLEVRKICDEIKRGATLSEAMSRQNYFSPVIIETTAVGEKTGALDEMLSAVASHYDLEVNHTVKNLTTLLEPVMLVGIFAVVALLALAIFLPIWNLSDAIGL